MKRILVGVDGSPHQRDVIRAALAAESGDAVLILMRVVTIPIELPLDLLTVTPDAVGPALLIAARSELDKLAATLPEKRVEEVRVEMGTPWRTLVEAAKEARADLLVIGSHGYGGIDRLLGTTAAKVVNHAPCSVLVVR